MPTQSSLHLIIQMYNVYDVSNLVYGALFVNKYGFIK